MTDSITANQSGSPGGGSAGEGGIGGFFKGIGRFFKAAGRITWTGIQVAWAAPNSAVGLAMGLAGLPFGAKIGFGNKAIQFTNYPWFGGWFRGWAFGNVQIYPSGNDPHRDVVPTAFGLNANLGRHEEGHTIQQMHMGIVALPYFFLARNRMAGLADAYALGLGSPVP